MGDWDKNGLGKPGIGAFQGNDIPLHIHRHDTMTSVQLRQILQNSCFRRNQVIFQRNAVESSKEIPETIATALPKLSLETPGFLTYTRRLLVPHLTQDSLAHLKPKGSLVDLNVEAW